MRGDSIHYCAHARTPEGFRIGWKRAGLSRQLNLNDVQRIGCGPKGIDLNVVERQDQGVPIIQAIKNEQIRVHDCFSNWASLNSRPSQNSVCNDVRASAAAFLPRIKSASGTTTVVFLSLAGTNGLCARGPFCDTVFLSFTIRVWSIYRQRVNTAVGSKRP